MFHFKLIQMKNKIYYTVLLSVVSLLFSCKKIVAIDDPIDQLPSKNVFGDSTTIESSINGLYVQQVTTSFSGFLNGNVTLYPALSGDEVLNTASSASFDPFVNNELSSSQTLAWANPYNIIYSCNLILEQLEEAPLNSRYKLRAKAEVLFIRALNYFYLVNFYGGVPLSLSSDYRLNAVLYRSSQKEVYDQILSDLKAAQLYIGEANFSSKVRVNKWTISALLARVYLYLEDYQSAAAESTKVIESNRFTLPDLSGAFVSGSPEAIYQFLPPVNQIFGVAEAYRFIPSSSSVKPTFVITESLLKAFESIDERKNKWLAFNTLAGVRYYYPSKYKVRSVVSGATKPEYNVVLRLAEMFLIRAESNIFLGKSTDAIADVNTIRKRALLNEIDPSQSFSKQQLLDIVYHEKQIEFFAEWGHRWFDLKRTKRVDNVMSQIKGGKWQSTDTLYPITLSEIQQNPNLVQNPGYN
jgi:hypothetical protein